MAWTLTLASLALISGLSQNPPLAEAPAATPASAPAPEAQSETRPPAWLISMRVAGPVTTTDPQHLAVAVGLAHSGAYRVAVEYQPTDAGRVGMIQASLGFRVLRRDTWQLAIDLEHAQARPVRRLFRGSGWELDGHDRHQLSIGIASIQWSDSRLFGIVDRVEMGFGRMHVWRLVSARAGSASLSTSPDPILESSAPVGVLGMRASHRLWFGLDGQAHLRVIGAGRSKGGEVPFAHFSAEWDVTRQLFQSKKFGRGSLGLTGNHATSPRTVSYFQNGLGLTFRLAF